MATRIWQRSTSNYYFDPSTPPLPGITEIALTQDTWATSPDTTVLRQLLDLTMVISVPTGQNPGPPYEWPSGMVANVAVGVGNSSNNSPLEMRFGADARITGTSQLSHRSTQPGPLGDTIQAQFNLLVPLDSKGERKSGSPLLPPIPQVTVNIESVNAFFNTVAIWELFFYSNWRILYSNPT